MSILSQFIRRSGGILGAIGRVVKVVKAVEAAAKTDGRVPPINSPTWNPEGQQPPAPEPPRPQVPPLPDIDS
jgi:hypothetical protein